MNEEQFSAFLGTIVPGVVGLVAGHYGLGEAEAADRFYSSRLYADLSDEHLKVWHYGPQTLFDLYRQEVETGRIEYPEEAC
jgi:hypothetical protein